MGRTLQKIRSTALVLLVLGSSATAYAGTDTFGQITVVTDYLFRGVSQTMSSAALQGELGIEFENGWYGYVWASNVYFVERNAPDDGVRIEANVGGGYSTALNDRLTATIEATSYLYPGAAAGVDYDYLEWHGMMALDDRHRLKIGYSEDVFNSGSDGLFYSLGTDWALTEYFGMFLELGHYDLEHAYDNSYSYGELAITGASGSVGWRLSYLTVTDQAEEMFPESTVGDRIVVALSLSF